MAQDTPSPTSAHEAERTDEWGTTRGVERRDVLKLATVIVLGSAVSELEPVAAFMGGGSPEPAGAAACMGGEAVEKYPTSPLILYPFTDPLLIPLPLAPVEVDDSWLIKPGYGVGEQDSYGSTHQIQPSQLGLPRPLVHRLKLQVAEHSFTRSKVLPIDKRGRTVGVARSLPKSTIYGFNGQFPGPMIYARYGQPALVRFENHLHENPLNLDRQDFGAPDLSFLTHLHNAHTAPESDGNPGWSPHGYQPEQYVDNLYLNYPAGGDEREKQSFFWFHDHQEGHTSSNVYKGMVGLYPIYDPVLDPGDETGVWQVSGQGFERRYQPTKGLQLPGVPNPSTGRVDYDIPLALYDCRLDDGVTPHKDFHSGCGETHREWWGKTFFLHFPNKGFVGDLFTVNGTAYPVLEVKRRKYRFRFLDASIARIYDLKLMQGKPVAAPGQQGQFQLPDGQQCMRFTEIAVDGGLLPHPIVRNSFELWPAKRREVVVDFTKYMDGSPTHKGDVLYLVNVAQMLTGRMPNGPLMESDNDVLVPDPEFDPNYRVPIMKIVIGDDAPDNSVIPPTLRELPVIDPRTLSRLQHRNFEFDREELGGEVEWTVNGLPFNPGTSLAFPKQGQPEVWTFRNKGNGWVHPAHLHMEEHRTLTRDGKDVVLPPAAPNVADGKHVDDCGKEDVVALGPAQEVTLYRNFRTFVGPYVVHCHNLAHEDHAMMFGWRIMP